MTLIFDKILLKGKKFDPLKLVDLQAALFFYDANDWNSITDVKESFELFRSFFKKDEAH